jgi:hypothetical protein
MNYFGFLFGQVGFPGFLGRIISQIHFLQVGLGLACKD